MYTLYKINQIYLKNAGTRFISVVLLFNPLSRGIPEIDNDGGGFSVQF